MANILESLSEMATPEVLGQISKKTGSDSALLNNGLGAVSATSLGSMAASASTEDLLYSFMKSATGSSGGTSGDMMKSILGSGTNPLGRLRWCD